MSYKNDDFCHLTDFGWHNFSQIEVIAEKSEKSFRAIWPIFAHCIKTKQNKALKAGEPGLFRPGSQSEGQLKERSEGGQAQ